MGKWDAIEELGDTCRGYFSQLIQIFHLFNCEFVCLFHSIDIGKFVSHLANCFPSDIDRLWDKLFLCMTWEAVDRLIVLEGDCLPAEVSYYFLACETLVVSGGQEKWAD